MFCTISATGETLPEKAEQAKLSVGENRCDIAAKAKPLIKKK